MLVLGKYNTGDYIIKSGIQPVLVVGWGEDGHEKDIFRLDSDGRIITKGDLWLDGGI